jgi:hypothetical protein
MVVSKGLHYCCAGFPFGYSGIVDTVIGWIFGVEGD